MSIVCFQEDEIHLRIHEGQLQCNFFTNTVHIINRPLDESIHKTCNRLYLSLEKANGKGKSKKGGSKGSKANAGVNNNNKNKNANSNIGIEFHVLVNGEWEMLDASTAPTNERGWQGVNGLRFGIASIAPLLIPTNEEELGEREREGEREGGKRIGK